MEFVDLTGQRFGHLTVVEFVGRRRHPGGGVSSMWKCQCECGNECIVSNSGLRSGTQSCGCKRIKRGKESHLYKHGESNTRLYKIWSDMKKRCYSKNYKDFNNYGGKGVRICDEWIGENGYESFRDWAISHGYDENAEEGKCTIDRINVDGNYEPKNCRWADASEQANNRTTSRFLTYKGVTHTVAEWAKILNVPYARLQSRIYLGWSAEDTIEIGKLKANRKHQKIERTYHIGDR